MVKHLDTKTKSYASAQENQSREKFFQLFKKNPIPENELLANLGLFLNRQTLSRIIFMNELYKKIIEVQGIIMEFGVRWGHDLALFESFRGIYEPYNRGRRLVGFDTFSGFPSVSEKDGKADVAEIGAYSTTIGYEEYLREVLDYHEKESPLSHINKYELVKGDATVTSERYFKDNPETIIALAYFDLDLYEPTKTCLASIKEHLTKGSVIGFDQLNYPDFPGETLALKEIFGLDAYKITCSPINPHQSYIVI